MFISQSNVKVLTHAPTSQSKGETHSAVGARASKGGQIHQDSKVSPVQAWHCHVLPVSLVLAQTLRILCI